MLCIEGSASVGEQGPPFRRLMNLRAFPKAATREAVLNEGKRSRCGISDRHYKDRR